MDKSKIKNIVREVLSEIKVNDPNPQYSFKELQNLIKLSGLNNPNKDQMEDAERRLTALGFYGEEGQILPKNFRKNFKTTDGKTLNHLLAWFKRNYI